MPRPRNDILWLDLETTGGNTEIDSILEVGAILTDNTLNEKFEFQAVAYFDYLKHPTEHINPIVYDMHMKSSLWADCAKSPWSIEGIDLQLGQWLTDNATDGLTVFLAGSGVSHFDIRFVKAFMPRLTGWLKGYDEHTTPTIDIGCMRRFAHSLVPQLETPTKKEDLKHRALDDARDHLNEARWWRKQLETVANFGFRPV